MRVLILLFLFCAFGARAEAQCLTRVDDIQLSEQSVISLITVSTGKDIASHWGHTALRIQDYANGIDYLYNYGAFRFDKTFVPKFIYGKLDYILCVSHMREEVKKYQAQGRSLIEQKLLLSLEERQQVFDFVEFNALPENRTYRYDFLFDNCSTRVLDLMEDVLGERLVYQSPLPQQTWRHILQSYVDAYPLLGFGIDLGLGLPVDQVPTARELMGLPIPMMQAYDEALVYIDGIDRPFVTQKDTLLRIDTSSDPVKARNQSFLLYGVLWSVFLLSLWITFSKTPKISRLGLWLDRVVFGLVGLAGMLAAFLWFIALHNVTNYNLNLLWAWPTHVFIVWTIGRQLKIVTSYMKLCAIVMVVLVAGWIFSPQPFHTALLPVVLTILVRSASRGWSKPRKFVA